MSLFDSCSISKRVGGNQREANNKPINRHDLGGGGVRAGEEIELDCENRAKRGIRTAF